MEEEPMNCNKEHKLRMMTGVPPENAKCSACNRTSSESGEALYYTCTDCHIMIHRKCAEMPKQIDHPMHPEHPLLLLARPPYPMHPVNPLLLFDRPPYESETCQCQVCQKSWENSVYHCSSCQFDIDILCAFLEDADITIPTHDHPVRLVPRPASFNCNACGVRESYMCTKPSCWFWIHKRCGSLSEMFKHPDHDHPLLLATTMPARYRKYNFTCEICHCDVGSSFWIYYCQQCKYFVHVKCMTLRAHAPTQWIRDHRASESHPPRLARIRQLKTIVKHYHSDLLQEESPQLPLVKVVGHRHSLVLNSDHNQDEEDEIICDGCIEPLTSPYYKCGQYCKFFLHTTCATLPSHLQALDQYYGYLSLTKTGNLYFPKNPWEVVKCYACDSFCNGYSYKYHWNGSDYYFDIKCCYLKLWITHIGHKHDLEAGEFDFQWRDPFMCRGCGEYSTSPHFFCAPCDFSLGYDCATLPATVKHRWDKHPLILCFPPHFRDG